MFNSFHVCPRLGLVHRNLIQLVNKVGGGHCIICLLLSFFLESPELGVKELHPLVFLVPNIPLPLSEFAVSNLIGFTPHPLVLQVMNVGNEVGQIIVDVLLEVMEVISDALLFIGNHVQSVRF